MHRTRPLSLGEGKGTEKDRCSFVSHAGVERHFGKEACDAYTIVEDDRSAPSGRGDGASARIWGDDPPACGSSHHISPEPVSVSRIVSTKSETSVLGSIITCFVYNVMLAPHLQVPR